MRFCIPLTADKSLCVCLGRDDDVDVKNLRGKDFEDYLRKNLGGKGQLQRGRARV